MEQIKILFFVIGSFFGMEDGNIAADNTTITINPQVQEITIIQENLFAVIQSEEDKEEVLNQWNKIYNWEPQNTTWSKELDAFTNKSIRYKVIDNRIQAHITLTYTTPKDLRALGLWHNEEEKQFSNNVIRNQHLKTNDGIIDGNYWIFKDDKTFSFSVAPFIELPEQYKKMIKTIDELVLENKK